MPYNFCSGVTIGFIFAGILGLTLQRYFAARTKMGRMNKTMDHFSDADQPKTTSWKVVKDSSLASVGCVFWFLFSIAIILLFAWIIFSPHS